jgi:hypothetical protein
MRELPAPESVGVADADLALNPDVPTAYTTMFFSVWRKRGLTEEETRARYRAHLNSPN